MEKPKEELSEAMRKFIHFYEVVKGKRDVKSRVQVMADPDNLKTMTILSHSQAEFVSIAYWVSEIKEYGDMWSGLKDYATLLMETNCSVGRKRAEQVIQFMGALSESKLLSKLGISLKGEGKEK